MARDDIWGSDETSREAVRPARPTPNRAAAGTRPIPSETGRRAAASKPIAPARPRGDDDFAMDEAIARLTEQIRGAGETPIRENKSRYDFRERARREKQSAGPEVAARDADFPDLDAAIAGIAARRLDIDRHWADSGRERAETLPPPPKDPVDDQLEAIRQGLTALSEGTGSAQKTAADGPGAESHFVIERLEAISQALPDANRIGHLSESVAKLSQIMAGPPSGLSAIENRLGKLSVDIAALSQRRPGDAELHSRLMEIRDLISAGQGRALLALDALTREIAALRRDIVAVPGRPDSTGPDNPVARTLKEDLRRLQAVRDSTGGGQASPLELTETMEKVVHRLASIEAEAKRKGGPAHQPPPSVPNAGMSRLESADDHRPLEPGSGQPSDRSTRGGNKADFIAAARRAAQAAAVESAVLEQEDARPRAGAFVWVEAIRAHRRPIAAAAAAAVLALAMLQIFSLREAEVLGGMLAADDAAPVAGDKADVSAADSRSLKTEARLTAPENTGAPPQEPAVAFGQPERFENRFTIVDPGQPSRFAFGGEANDSSPSAPAVTASTPSPPADTADLRPEPPVSMQAAPMPPEAAGPPRLRAAAATGDPAALFEIGARYAEGRGVQTDPAEAAKWYRLAAERGLAMAQFRIASLSERGEGVPKDRSAAADWYRRAAEQGNVRAMHNLAVMLSDGVSGSPDFTEAARWFATAAEHGVRDSQYNLGVMFARGLGSPADLVQAYKWFAIAAQLGDADASARRDEVANLLSPDQVAQAQAAVLAWRAAEAPERANVPPVAEDGWDGPPGPVTSLDRPALVRMIQERLADRGFDPGPVDGRSGPMTREAVIAFQREVGATATGEIGPELLAALDLPAR